MFGKTVKLTLIAALWSLFIFGFHVSFAQDHLKDSDFDGIPDNLEVTKYKTDPLKEDTDGDGILDYQEVLDGTDPNNAQSNALTSLKNQQGLLSQGLPIFWYIGRAAGIASFIMFTVVVILGLLMTSKFLMRFKVFSAPDALEMHSFNASFLALTLVVIHFSSFMFDAILHFNLRDILIPFQIKSDVISGLGFNLNIPVALGIFAFYIALLLVGTSRLRKKLVPLKAWRAIHYLSFIFYVLFLVHGVLSGTDTKEPWMIAIYAGSAITVFTLILFRIFGKQYFINAAKVKFAQNMVNTPKPAQEQATPDNSQPTAAPTTTPTA